MCNLSKGIAEKAMERGMKQGMEQGMKQGMEKGITESLLTSIRNLMDSMNLTAEQAMGALKVAEGDRTKYLTLLGKQ